MYKDLIIIKLMSHITINFEILKYNLYEVLGIDSKASEIKIKKAFRNLILNFHPDKNNSIEEDIYYHIITANQVLINTETRKKYDEFLNKLQNTHDDLKNNFNKIIKSENILQHCNSELKQTNLSDFDKCDKDKILNAYSKLLREREKIIDIPKEDIKTNNDFNTKFENKILTENVFNEKIIPISEKMELSTMNINDNYTSLDIAFNNLYIDGDEINNTNKFSSLDSAFKIQQINLKDFKEVNIKEAIDAYKNETTKLSTLNF